MQGSHRRPKRVSACRFGQSRASSLISVRRGAGTQSSLKTVFVIWNTMMGSSLLAMPWGFQQAGLLGGVITVIVVGFVCFYTCTLVVKCVL